MVESIRWAPLVASAMALALLLAFAMIDWRRRVDDWRCDVQRLVDRPPRRVAVSLGLAVIASVSGVAALVVPAAASPALAAAASALTCLGIGHRQNWRILGGVGLALASGCVVLTTTHYAWSGFGGIGLGASLTAAWMLWLARFWSQQLHDGQPWTTAGRLIPAARIVAAIYAVVGLCAAAAAICG